MRSPCQSLPVEVGKAISTLKEVSALQQTHCSGRSGRHIVSNVVDKLCYLGFGGLAFLLEASHRHH